ncbi:2-hydroxyacyl-CoA dehydratase family protein [Limisalsivibrio acetivorans]|uniref:2-hydroxyacyl-CoA dehydratase family protein n=1 Tax=Limisalsivibrio acetivorans TaxID=1304888 RepID=UPI0003B54500|nr:2-hydroxyacyl-CoA dehydratase [Limisalsivibrio acetivorans]
MKRIGFTTTIPVELVMASGGAPCDLNNVFITSENPSEYIDFAESEGLPRNICAWIKGIYTAVVRGAVDEVIAVTEGDCSNSHALAELFMEQGIPVHSFAYPFGKSDRLSFLKNEFEGLASSLGTTVGVAMESVKRTDRVRSKLRELDRLTVEGRVTGFENHITLVSSTDFNGDIDTYEKELDALLYDARGREPSTNSIRIGVLGVPTIFDDIYAFLEERGAQVVFNEIQRQFSIPSTNPDYIARYAEYTYPYDVFTRLEDIQKQVEERKIHGLIHYVQSFCYRQMQDITMRKHLDVPVLTVEGDGPGGIDSRTRIRVESFLEMLEAKHV